jgi:hypothetical protein
MSSGFHGRLPPLVRNSLFSDFDSIDSIVEPPVAAEPGFASAGSRATARFETKRGNNATSRISNRNDGIESVMIILLVLNS